jgi:hypothetical protein
MPGNTARNATTQQQDSYKQVYVTLVVKMAKTPLEKHDVERELKNPTSLLNKVISACVLQNILLRKAHEFNEQISQQAQHLAKLQEEAVLLEKRIASSSTPDNSAYLEQQKRLADLIREEEEKLKRAEEAAKQLADLQYKTHVEYATKLIGLYQEQGAQAIEALRGRIDEQQQVLAQCRQELEARPSDQRDGLEREVEVLQGRIQNMQELLTEFEDRQRALADSVLPQLSEVSDLAKRTAVGEQLNRVLLSQTAFITHAFTRLVEYGAIDHIQNSVFHQQVADFIATYQSNNSKNFDRSFEKTSPLREQSKLTRASQILSTETTSAATSQQPSAPEPDIAPSSPSGGASLSTP